MTTVMPGGRHPQLKADGRPGDMTVDEWVTRELGKLPNLTSDQGTLLRQILGTVQVRPARASQESHQAVGAGCPSASDAFSVCGPVLPALAAPGIPISPSVLSRHGVDLPAPREGRSRTTQTPALARPTRH